MATHFYRIWRPNEPDVAHPSQHRLERDPHLGAQLIADTQVRTRAEREVLAGIGPIGDGPVGIVELVRIAAPGFPAAAR